MSKDKAKTNGAAAPKYVAVVGLTLKDGSRVEPGERYPGKPPRWLVDQGKVKAKG